MDFSPVAASGGGSPVARPGLLTAAASLALERRLRVCGPQQLYRMGSAAVAARL